MSRLAVLVVMQGMDNVRIGGEKEEALVHACSAPMKDW